MPYFRIQGPHIQAFTYESGITSLVLSPLSNELNISEDSFKMLLRRDSLCSPSYSRLTCAIRDCTALASPHLSPKPKPKNPSLCKRVFIQKSTVGK